MNEQEARDWIDNATYEMLLRKWRFAPVGDETFKGPLGKHYLKVMQEKKARLGPGEAAAISKLIGHG